MKRNPKGAGRKEIDPVLRKKKRAVSLTDIEFEKSKQYYGSPSKAVLFALELKEKLQ